MYLRALDKMKQWLLLEENEERRRTPRRAKPEIVVHYWDGSAPKGRHIRDVSRNGAYIYSPERWYIGTIVRLILQGYRTAVRNDGAIAPMASTCVPARVVRHGSDGVAVEFVFCNKSEEAAFQTFLTEIPAPPASSAFGETAADPD
jgi:hypothetical protein